MASGTPAQRLLYVFPAALDFPAQLGKVSGTIALPRCMHIMNDFLRPPRCRAVSSSTCVHNWVPSPSRARMHAASMCWRAAELQRPPALLLTRS